MTVNGIRSAAFCCGWLGSGRARVLHRSAISAALARRPATELNPSVVVVVSFSLCVMCLFNLVLVSKYYGVELSTFNGCYRVFLSSFEQWPLILPCGTLISEELEQACSRTDGQTDGVPHFTLNVSICISSFLQHSSISSTSRLIQNIWMWLDQKICWRKEVRKERRNTYILLSSIFRWNDVRREP